MKKFLKKILNKVDKKTKRQILRFFIAGCGAVGTDTIVYFLLINLFLDDIGYNISKLISFLSGTIVAFIINKYWTFESKQKSLFEIIAFLILYCVTLGLNVSVNWFVLKVTSITLLAFLIATGCSTVVNFLGQKFWVFKRSTS